MTAALRFDPIRLPPECEQLRKEVRAFLAEEIGAGTFDPYKPNREDTDVPEFSRKVGAKGWLGMTWPKKYGGHERSFLERYVVTEEMRVANAPTRRFFVSTTTDFVRPCEKLCRTVFCSDGRFSDSFGVARWSVFSPGALVSVSLIPLIFLRTRRPHLVSS